jgi:sulfate adenylyltransferase
MPVTLDVSADFAEQARSAGRIALRDPESVLLALMHVESVWRPDKTREAHALTKRSVKHRLSRV